MPGLRANRLDVTFAEDVAESGRFMACTGGSHAGSRFSGRNGVSAGTSRASLPYLAARIYILTVLQYVRLIL